MLRYLFTIRVWWSCSNADCRLCRLGRLWRRCSLCALNLLLLFLFLLPWFAEGVHVRFTFCHAQRSMEANSVRQSKIPEEFPQKDLLSPVGKIPHLLI